MTVKEHFNRLLNEMEDVVNKHPFHAFALLAIMIEVLGKCLSPIDWQQGGNSQNDFNQALERYPSLQKYKGIPNLYSILRCGMVHALLLKSGVILVPDKNDIVNSTIGGKELYRDICQAWEDLKSRQVIPQKDLDANVMSVNGNASGTTISTNIRP